MGHQGVLILTDGRLLGCKGPPNHCAFTAGMLLTTETPVSAAQPGVPTYMAMQSGPGLCFRQQIRHSAAVTSQLGSGHLEAVACAQGA